MIDFLLTPEGDLSFVESETQDNKLKINFYSSQKNALRITFEMEGVEELNADNAGLCVTFNLLKVQYNNKALMAKDEQYIIQQLMTRLKTSLGELPDRQNIGSTLETVMHKNLTDKQVKNNIEKIVSTAISGLLDNYSVKAIPTIDKTDGYKQAMVIKIYQDEQLLLSYEMEG